MITMVINHLHSLKLSESVKIGDPKRKQSSSNHPFSGALADSFREDTSTGSPSSKYFCEVCTDGWNPMSWPRLPIKKSTGNQPRASPHKPDISIVLLGCLVDRGHVKNRMVLIIESPYHCPWTSKPWKNEGFKALVYGLYLITPKNQG